MSLPKLRCLVCNGIASGFNYSGLSCESCKVFFCRNSSRLESFRCDYGGNCEIDMSTRRYCAKCRLVKCFAIGMKKKKKMKNENNLESKLTNRIESIMQISTLRNVNQLESIKPIFSEYPTNIFQKDNLRLSLSLNPFEHEYITEARNAISIFCSESTAKVIKRITNVQQLAAFPHNMLYIKKTIEFCQKFRVFNSLANEDQLKIIKPVYFYVNYIWSAFQYDLEKNGFRMFVDETETNAVFIGTDILAQCFPNQEYYHLTMNTAIELYNALEKDVNIRDLICAIGLFKSQRNFSNLENVRYHYHLYCSILQRYLQHKHQSNYFKAEANQRYLALMHLLDQLDKNFDAFKKMMQSKNVPSVIMELYDLV